MHIECHSLSQASIRINPNRKQLLLLSESRCPRMACISNFRLLAVLSLFLVRCEALAASQRFRAPVSTAVNEAASICHDGLMSAYLPKAQFADLPFTIYVHGKSDAGHQVRSNQAVFMEHFFIQCVKCLT